MFGRYIVLYEDFQTLQVYLLFASYNTDCLDDDMTYTFTTSPLNEINLVIIHDEKVLGIGNVWLKSRK